jgi:hypothetical protein
MVHEIIAINKCQYVFLVEVKRNVREIMCPNLTTTRDFMSSISVMLAGTADFMCGITRTVSLGDW